MQLSDRPDLIDRVDAGGRELPAPRATRLPRPRWLDPRLMLGLLLVLASVVAGARIVSAADDRVQVWSLRRDLGPDVQLSSSDVTAVAVRLDQVGARYVGADQDVTNFVLTRPVAEGELLPVAALRPADDVEQRRVVVEVDRVGVGGLRRGSVVDLYLLPGENGQPDPSAEPELVLAGVTVAEDIRSGGGFGSSGSSVGVALTVAETEVQRLLAAVARGSLYLVSVPA